MKKIIDFLIVVPMVFFAFNSTKETTKFVNSNQRYSHGDLIDPTNPVEPGTNPLLLNVLTEVSIGIGQTKYFIYTPHDTALYCIETFGNHDTILEANDSINSIADDNSGEYFNSRIYFSSTPYYPIAIRVRLKSTTSYGTISLQIRKYTFSMFAYNGGNINTIPDLTDPYTLFSPYINCQVSTNVEASYALQTDDRNLTRINSEIFFYSGHGSSTSLCFFSEDVYSYFSINNVCNLNQVQTAILSACESSYEDTDNPVSIARHFVNSGAKSSIGFNKSIFDITAKIFTDYFFCGLSNNCSVKKSAEYAKWHIIWPFDPIRDYVIFGDEDTTVATPSTTNVVFNDQINHVDPSLLLMINEGFIEHSISSTTSVFYQVINNCISSNVVVLEYDNNDNLINTVNGTQNVINTLNINDAFLNLQIASTRAYNNATLYLNEIVSRNVVYYNFNGVMTPIEISVSNYTDIDGNSYAFSDCINLSNGSVVDYDNICTIVENVGNGNVIE